MQQETSGRPPGAMRELAQDDSSRKQFLRLMGGTGAAAMFSVFLAACGDDDDGGSTSGGGATGAKESTGGDVEIVQYALTLEHVETDFYDAVIASGVITDAEIGETAKLIRDNEQEHVDALTAVLKDLGGKPKRPKTNFDAVIEGGPQMVLETGATVENLGAAAYLGQAGRIQSKDILAALLSIHTVEARHAATLNQLVGKSFVPDGAFAKPASMAEVLPKVKPFLA